MANPILKDHVAIAAAPTQLPMESEKAQSGLHVAHSRIVLTPHPSDDPRDPLVCFMLIVNGFPSNTTTLRPYNDDSLQPFSLHTVS